LRLAKTEIFLQRGLDRKIRTDLPAGQKQFDPFDKSATARAAGENIMTLDYEPSRAATFELGRVSCLKPSPI
jgi:hypothetical protein